MFRSYLLAALRNLRKNRGFSILNIAGLAVGIACAALILLWVEDEVTYDHSVPDHDRIARVMQTEVDHGQATGPFVAAPGPLGPAIREEITGVRNVARTSNNSDLEEIFGIGDKVIRKQGNFADSSLIPMLGLQFVYGHAAHAFDQLHSVILSQEFAAELFGAGVDPVGKQVQVEHKDNFLVTGVYKDLPVNSTIRFSWLSPYSNFEAMMPWAKRWDANGIATYVQLEPKADPAAVDRQLAHFIDKKVPGGAPDIVCWLFPMNSWHLYSSFTNGYPDGKGDIRYVKLFLLIALIILVIACINFMNLSTAKSAERAKEVGVRKVMGAERRKLISQFIGESMVLSFVSLLVAVGIVYLALGPFNQLVGKQLTPDLLKPAHLGVLLGIGLVTGLVAGSYPAFYLSSFSPVSVLNTVRLRGGNWVAFIRKGLVIAQFTISILLIICTTIVYQQVGFARLRDWGFSRNDLFSMDVVGAMQPRYNAIRADLLETGVVGNTALSMDNITSTGWWSTDGYQWPGKPVADDHVTIENEQVTASYFATEGMKIIAGRGFRDDSHAEDNHIVINESMAKLIGAFAKPGNIIHMGDRALTIIGIVHDFVFNNGFAATAGPMVIFGGPDNANYMTVRLKAGVDLGVAMAKVAEVMKRDNPGYPFQFQFMDEQLDRMFRTETLMGRLAAIFTVLAIFISCLGLFGLAAYSAARRAREIGIRKVLGASTQGLATLLSRDFVKWVLVSCLIAFPLGWWLMKGWLQDYEYRTPIHWWVFGAAGLAALSIALLTVCVQALRAALASPVRSLRSE
ncbi:MAG TPA: ABC transporter permease [Puia sp.]|nr:ABC transporter permease [Puia sp.]